METPPDSLSRALQDWQVNLSRNPSFRHRVWERIAKRKQETWSGYLRTHAAVWVVVGLTMMGAAAYTGHAAARSRVRTDREALVVSYLVDLDPRVQAVLKP